ncbi:MAG: formyltransferase family protein [Candidatus Paceibacterota bacterium]|jgi:folate-dependent phosphoribosylglycinamide formyltransferase PurN
MSLKNKKKLLFLVHEGSAQTNLKAVRDAIDAGTINAEISLVVSDSETLPNLEKISPDYICLAGWKKIIPEELIQNYKILNMHPGLIPDSIDGTVKNPDGTDALWNKGKFTTKAIQNFIDQKATYAGSSIHFLTSEFDFGPVLGRCFEKIETGDTVESLYSRLKKKENELYVEVLKNLSNNEYR